MSLSKLSIPPSFYRLCGLADAFRESLFAKLEQNGKTELMKTLSLLPPFIYSSEDGRCINLIPSKEEIENAIWSFQSSPPFILFIVSNNLTMMEESAKSVKMQGLDISLFFERCVSMNLIYTVYRDLWGMNKLESSIFTPINEFLEEFLEIIKKMFSIHSFDELDHFFSDGQAAIYKKKLHDFRNTL